MTLGKVQQKYTAAIFAVRVERRGKSSPADGKPCSPVNPIRSNISYGYTCPTCRERWREPCGNIRPRKMVVQDRTRLIDSVAKKKASGLGVYSKGQFFRRIWHSPFGLCLFPLFKRISAAFLAFLPLQQSVLLR